jgi:CrcB protein
LLLGGLSQAAPVLQIVSPTTRTIAAAGFLGALTTFSTFGAETIERLHRGQVLVGMTNVGANVCFGLLAVWIGAMLARGLFGEP